MQPITFSHAGRWECRAVYSDSTKSSPVNAGVVTLTVFSECYIELQCTFSVHVRSKLMMHDVHTN